MSSSSGSQKPNPVITIRVKGKYSSCSVLSVSGPSGATYSSTSWGYSQYDTPEVGSSSNVWYTTFKITVNGISRPGGWTVSIGYGNGYSSTGTAYVHWYSEQILAVLLPDLDLTYGDIVALSFSAQNDHDNNDLNPVFDQGAGGQLSIGVPENMSNSGFRVQCQAYGITNGSTLKVYIPEVITHDGFWHHGQSNILYLDYSIGKKQNDTPKTVNPTLTIKNPSGGTGNFSMIQGNSAQLIYESSHSNVSGSWSSNNTSVASLSNINTTNRTATINANATGSATITVKSSEFKRTVCYYSSPVEDFSYTFTYEAASDTITVTVNPPKYDSAVQIKRNGSTSNFTLPYGQSATLTAVNGYGGHTWSLTSGSISYSPTSGTSTTVTTWVASGTSTIKVTCAGNDTYYGSSDTITITSVKASNSITAYVNGSSSNATVFVGDSGYISYHVNYNTGTVTYSSYDPSIAYVDGSGNISFNKAGTVTLLASAPANSYYNQAEDSITVTVKKRAGSVTALYSNSSSNYQTRWLGEGNFYLTCRNNRGTVTWSSSSPSLASINNSGLVTVNTEATTDQNVTFTVNDSGNYMYEASSDTIIITLKAKQYAYLDLGILNYNWAYDGHNVTQNIQWTPNISTYNLEYRVHLNNNSVPNATNVTIWESGNGVTDVRGTSAYTLHIIKPGTDQIQASWSGNYAYFPISSGCINLNIAKCTQVMTLSGGGTRRYGNDPLSFNITNSFLYSLVNTNLVNYSATGNTNYITTSKKNESTLAVTVKQPGTIYVTASVAANTYWNSASSSQITVTVNKGDPGLEAYNGSNYISQTIIKTYTNSNFTLSYQQYLYNGAAASAPSVGWYTSDSNVISISNSGVCTVVGAGQCTVYAYSNANTYWNYKKSQNVSIIVNKFTPTITFNGYSATETGTTFTSRYGYYHPGPWKVNGHNVSSGLTYSCGLTVDTAGNVIASSAGNYPCTVNFAGNANYNAVNNVKINFSVSKMYLNIINSPSSINITYRSGGTAFNVTHTIEPAYLYHVYWSANIDYTMTPTNGLLATVTHNNLGTSKKVQYTGILPGSTDQGILVVVNETSNYYGVSTYIPVRVNKGSAMASISNLTATYYHGRTDNMVADITDNSTGGYLPSDLITYSTTGTYTTVNSSGVINYTKAGGSDTITIKLSSKGLNYYNETSKTSTLTIHKGSVTIGWSPTPPTSLTYDYHNRTDVFGYTLKDTNSSADLKPHNYCASKISYLCTGVVSSVSGGTIKYSKAGSGSITAYFDGNDFYNNNSLSTNITLSKGTPTVNVGSVTFTYSQNNTTKTVNAKVYDKNGTNLPLTINLTPTTNSIDYITPTSGTSSFNTTIYFKNCSNVDYIKGSSVANDFWNAATHDPGGKITPSKGTVESASITPVNSAPLTTIGSVTFTGTFTSTGFDHSNYIKWSSSSTNIADFQQTTNDTGKTQILTVKTKGKVTITATYESPYWNTKTVTTTFTAYQPISFGLTVNTSTGCNSTNLNIKGKTVAISGNSKQVFIPYSDSTGLDNSTMMSKTTVTCPSVSIPLDIQSNGLSFTLTESMNGKAVTITTPVYRTSNYYEYSWLYDNYYYTTTTANQTNIINVVNVGRNTRKGKIANKNYIYTNYGTFDAASICPTFSEITTGNRNINVKVAGDGDYASNQLVVETDIYREVY